MVNDFTGRPAAMIFISHSFEDLVLFQNVADALEAATIKYFPPETIRIGADLAVELRKVIQASEACIFVATRRSVHSQWCLAELGAFWGAGKPVLVNFADEQLSDKELPPYLHGNLFERRIKKIVDSVKVILAEAKQAPAARRIGDLTLPEFNELLASSMQRVQGTSSFAFTLSRLADALHSAQVSTPLVIDLLRLFVGWPETIVRSSNAMPWRYSTEFRTTTGYWYALSSQFEDVHGENVPGLEIMRECLLIRLEHGRAMAAAVVSEIRDFSYAGTGAETTFSIGTTLAVAGAGEVGEAVGSLKTSTYVPLKG